MSKSNTSIHFQKPFDGSEWYLLLLQLISMTNPKQRVKQHSELPLEVTVATQFHLLVSIKLLTISIKHSTT